MQPTSRAPYLAPELWALFPDRIDSRCPFPCYGAQPAMIGDRMRALALSTAFAIICSAPPAIAAQFDGNWIMVAVTTSGHCGEIPIDVGISRGRIYSAGGSSFGTAFVLYPIQVVGRVSPRGRSG